MNIIYVLLVFAHVGLTGSGNSNALITQEFNSKEKCEAAAKEFSKLASGTVKSIETKCVEK
jgi:hypothetical protein